MAPPYVAHPRRALVGRTMQARVPPGGIPFDLIRRRRRPRVSERSRRQGVLVAPSRVLSVGTTQGAFSTPAAGVTFPTSDGQGINWWIDVTITDVDPASVPDDPLSIAVAAGRRHPIWQLTADWDRDGYLSPLADLTDVVSAINIDRSAVGDLPGEVSLIEGTTIAQATITLEGDLGSQGIFEALAPYRADSPLYRTDVVNTPATVAIGMVTSTGPELLTQLVGNIRSIKPDSGARTVELTMLDPADQVRAPITLPAYGMDRDLYLTQNHKFYVNTQAVIDYILRKNGIYASTAPHPNAQVSCTGHGWLAAELGRSSVPRGPASVIDDDTWWVPGPFDMLAVRGIWSDPTAGNYPFQDFYTQAPHVPVAGNGVGVAAWLRVGNDMTDVTASTNRLIFKMFPLVDENEVQLTLGINSTGALRGSVWFNGVETAFSATNTQPTQWMYCALHFQHMSTGVTRVRFRINGATSFGDITTPVFVSPPSPFMRASALFFRDWSNFHVWYDPNPPVGAWPGETPLLQADIDVGLNQLTHLPDIVNADSWQLITEVTAAEYGLCGFTETGRPYFRARDAATVALTSVEEQITADRALIDLVTETSADSVRNVISTETSAAFMDFQNVVFESQVNSQFDTPTGTSTYQVQLPYGAVGTATQEIPQILDANWGSQFLWGYVAVQAPPGNPAVEIDIADDLTVQFTMTGDRTGTLTVRNNTAHRVRFATVSGQPALRVQGWLLEATPVAVEYSGSQGSVDTFGTRLLAIGSSPWRQLLSSMRPVAVRLLAQLAWPVPVVDQFTALGNPARRVGDTVRVVDPAGHGSIKATLTKIGRRISDQGFVDTITVRPVGPPGILILDDPEFGILDDPDLWLTP